MSQLKYKSLIRNLILFIILSLFICSSMVFYISLFIYLQFGTIPFSQVIFHVLAGTNGAHIPSKMMIKIIVLSIICIVQIFSYLYIYFKFFRYKKFLSLFSVTNYICVIGLSIGMLFFANNVVGLDKYYTTEDSNFIQNNYYRLDEFNFQNEGKKNLIILFLESYEDGYFDKNIYGDNLLGELSKYKDSNVSFKGYKWLNGTQFTIGGVSSVITGVPLVSLGERFGIDLHSTDPKFDVILKGTPSIFNLLKNDGYVTAAFLGSSEHFTEQGKFLKHHGIDNIYSKEYFYSKYYNDDASWWGFNDVFLFDRLKEFLTNQPYEHFAVLLETIDTHFPNGFSDYNECIKNFGDIRDSFLCSSGHIDNFLKWAHNQAWYDDTVILLVGDHPWQDFNYEFTEFTKNSKDREIFNVFLNTPLKSNNYSIDHGYSSIDFAPTILQLMGINFTSVSDKGQKSQNKIGLGVSLISDDLNLLGKYGVEHLYSEIEKRSKFYDNLFVQDFIDPNRDNKESKNLIYELAQNPNNMLIQKLPMTVSFSDNTSLNTKGLHQKENHGVWSRDDKVEFLFVIDKSLTNSNINLIFSELKGFVTSKNPTVEAKVYINKSKKTKWNFNTDSPYLYNQEIRVDKNDFVCISNDKTCSFTLTIKIQGSAIPYSLDENDKDMRKLGIHFNNLLIK